MIFIFCLVKLLWIVLLSDIWFFITMFSPRSVRFGTDSSQVFNLLQSGAVVTLIDFDAFMNFFGLFTFKQGLAAAVQLNQYLEENAIIQLDQKAGKDQGKFQVILSPYLIFVTDTRTVSVEKNLSCGETSNFSTCGLISHFST